MGKPARLILWLRAAEAGVIRFVFLSSIKVNGETTSGGEPFSPSDDPGPSDPYGVSKKEAEDTLREIARDTCTRMEVVIIRSPLVYGAGIKGNFESLLKLSDSGNPSSVTGQELEAWRSEKLLELSGYRTDIADQYAANIVRLPSYREGLPKRLVEAAACGRAVVTTDVPGCRDAIEPGIKGLLVPVKDASALADAIQELVELPKLRARMRVVGRRLAEEVFAIETMEQHMEIYRELLADD